MFTNSILENKSIASPRGFEPENQKNVFFEIDPFATSKDLNQRITKIDLLKPKKSHCNKTVANSIQFQLPDKLELVCFSIT